MLQQRQQQQQQQLQKQKEEAGRAVEEGSALTPCPSPGSGGGGGGSSGLVTRVDKSYECLTSVAVEDFLLREAAVQRWIEDTLQTNGARPLQPALCDLLAVPLSLLRPFRPPRFFLHRVSAN